MTTPFAALQQIWSAAGCEPAALRHVTLTGADPVLQTQVKIGTAATAVIAATALAAPNSGA
jgi:predicted ATPase